MLTNFHGYRCLEKHYWARETILSSTKYPPAPLCTANSRKKPAHKINEVVLQPHARRYSIQSVSVSSSSSARIGVRRVENVTASTAESTHALSNTGEHW